MFETIRGDLRSKIEKNTIAMKIEEKLQTFLTENPDVDHYISDNNRRLTKANFWLGTFLGVLITLFFALFAFFVCIMVWHNLGYVNIPGLTS